jgi:bacillithiol system protein YtxJ
MVEDCRTLEDYSGLVAESHERPVFLFKHSTSCPISAGRWRLLQEYAGRESRAAFYKLLVIQDRPVSMHVAQESGVRHQSPQAILFSGGKPVWNASHYRITEEDMAAALERALT